MGGGLMDWSSVVSGLPVAPVLVRSVVVLVVVVLGLVGMVLACSGMNGGDDGD